MSIDKYNEQVELAQAGGEFPRAQAQEQEQDNFKDVLSRYIEFVVKKSSFRPNKCDDDISHCIKTILIDHKIVDRFLRNRQRDEVVQLPTCNACLFCKFFNVCINDTQNLRALINSSRGSKRFTLSEVASLPKAQLDFLDSNGSNYNVYSSGGRSIIHSLTGYFINIQQFFGDYNLLYIMSRKLDDFSVAEYNKFMASRTFRVPSQIFLKHLIQQFGIETD